LRQFIKKVLDIPASKTSKKQIIFLSDDWGSVGIRSKADQEALVHKGYQINNRFELYDSLETTEDLELLFEVLTKYKDHKGKYPVITAVTNTGNPDFKIIKASGFQNYAYETIHHTYQRYEESEKVLELIKTGILEKIFIPQSHGREHLQVNWWMKELKKDTTYARKFFENEFYLLNPKFISQPKRGRGFSSAFDVWSQEDLEIQKVIIQTGLNDFEKLFGYHSKIFTPPAIFYNPSIEKQLACEGIEWLDVGRYFKIPKVGGDEKWQLNYLGRKKKSGLKVLVRNGMFESNISDTDNGVNRALYDIENAFKAKQPALLSNHRASFVGRLDENNRAKGLKALDELLRKVLTKWPDVEFVSAVDFINDLE
jgi:hypothetical protein